MGEKMDMFESSTADYFALKEYAVYVEDVQRYTEVGTTAIYKLSKRDLSDFGRYKGDLAFLTHTRYTLEILIRSRKRAEELVDKMDTNKMIQYSEELTNSMRAVSDGEIVEIKLRHVIPLLEKLYRRNEDKADCVIL